MLEIVFLDMPTEVHRSKVAWGLATKYFFKKENWLIEETKSDKNL